MIFLKPHFTKIELFESFVKLIRMLHQEAKALVILNGQYGYLVVPYFILLLEEAIKIAIKEMMNKKFLKGIMLLGGGFSIVCRQ